MTSTTTSASGGEGGTGGGPPTVDCGALQVAGPPAFLDGGAGMYERHPLWVYSSEDGQQVTLLVSRQQAEGPEGPEPPTSIVHTTLKPWAAFPSGAVLGPTHLADPEGGRTFAVARAGEDRFGMLFTNTVPPGFGLQFSSGFVPFEDASPASVPVSSVADEALFAVRGPGGHLIGMQGSSVAGGSSYLVEAAFVGEDGSFTGPLGLGCAKGWMFADAVRAGGSYLVALSSAGVPGEVDCEDPSSGWPDDVQIVVTDGAGFTVTDSLGAPGTATDVKMAARSDGAWVVIGTPPGQVVSGMFLGSRVDAAGKVVLMFPVGGGSGEPGAENPQNGTLTAARLGDQLAVAWVDYGGDKGPFLRVKVFDVNGLPTGHAEIFPGTSFSGAPSLLGSPAGDSLVLAWSETPDQGVNDGDKLRAVRIDCVLGQ